MLELDTTASTLFGVNAKRLQHVIKPLLY